MKILNIDNEMEFPRNVALTIGFFDGVHLGHSMLIHTIKKNAKLKNIPTVLYTFSQRPKNIAHDYNCKLLTPLKEKSFLIEKMGVDYLFAFPFDKSTSNIHYRDFLKGYIINKFSPKVICVGHDFHFGYKGEGNADKLLELSVNYNFQLKVVDAVKIDDKIVSSTRIRNLIKCGNIEDAARFLNYYYFAKGRVIEGEKRGRMLGFPTANLSFIPEKLIPSSGVYAAQVSFRGKMWPAVVNIGLRPTFGEGKNTFEVHLIDLPEESYLYGEELCVYFVQRLRDEVKFPNAQCLIEKIKEDKNKAKRILREETNSDFIMFDEKGKTQFCYSNLN